MAFLGSGTEAVSSKFGSDALKIKQFSIRTLAKFEFERDVFFSSGSAAEGAALGIPPTPTGARRGGRGEVRKKTKFEYPSVKKQVLGQGAGHPQVFKWP